MSLARATGSEWKVMLQTAGILIVDDEPSMVMYLEAILGGLGYERIASTTDSTRVVSIFREFRPDLVLLDLHMGEVSGLDLLDQLQDEIPPYEFLPIMVLTGDNDPDIRFQSFVLGARDFMRKPIDQAELLLRVRVRLETRFHFLALQRENDDLKRALDECTGRVAPPDAQPDHR